MNLIRAGGFVAKSISRSGMGHRRIMVGSWCEGKVALRLVISKKSWGPIISAFEQ